MAHFLVLIDAYRDNHDVTIVDNWESMSEEQQVDFLNDHTQIIGRLCAGVYEGETPNDALKAAEDDWQSWAGGCVA